MQPGKKGETHLFFRGAQWLSKDPAHRANKSTPPPTGFLLGYQEGKGLIVPGGLPLGCYLAQRPITSL